MGKAVKVQLALPPQIEVAMMVPAGEVVPTKNTTKAAPSRAMAIHSPLPSSSPKLSKVIKAS